MAVPANPGFRALRITCMGIFFGGGGGGWGGGNLWFRNGLVFFGSLRSSVGVLPDFHPHSIIPVT